MELLGYILFFTILCSVVSILGGALLLLKEKWAFGLAHYLTSFAAGALLGTAFLDLLPEAFELNEHNQGSVDIFLWGLLGLLIFFLLERFIHWFHHHHDHAGVQSTRSLIVLGDSVHNFIDGVTIAAAFLVSVPLGIVTALAVAAHEIPQEIGDFGILLHSGLKRKKVLFYNFVSALAAVAGALITFFIGEAINSSLPILLSVTAGFFIYIASSDLIPEIHHEHNRKVAVIQTLLLLCGVVVIYLSVSLLEGH